MRFWPNLHLTATALAVAFASAAPAAAQIPADASAMPAVPDGIRITVGASVATAPLYEGSNRYGVWALPIIRFSMLGKEGASGGSGIASLLKSFDARALDDVSFGLFQHRGFEFGVLAGYRTGRLAKDAPHLLGFGDLDGGLVAGGYVRYDLKPFYARASLHQQVTGDDTGLLVRLAVGSEFNVTKAVLLKADAFLEFANSTYMDAYFGVNTQQSQRSGLATFDPSAGLKGIGARLGTELAVTHYWTLHASAGYTRLLGDAADSPIVRSADRFDAQLGLSRSVDLNWK